MCPFFDFKEKEEKNSAVVRLIPKNTLKLRFESKNMIENNIRCAF